MKNENRYEVRRTTALNDAARKRVDSADGSRWQLSGFVVVACFMIYPITTNAEEFVSSQAIKKVSRQLVSPLQAEQRAAEQWLAKHQDEAILLLIKTMTKSDGRTRQAAARSITLILSPWTRGIESRKIHRGQIQLYTLRRPVERPIHHKHAKSVRAAAMSSLKAALKQKVPINPKSNEDFEAINLKQMWVIAASNCLSGVGNGTTANELASLLSQQTDTATLAPLIQCLESIHGLPPSFRRGGMCGNSSQDEWKQFEREEQSKAQNAATALLKWHEKHRGQSVEARVDAALNTWFLHVERSTEFYMFAGEGDWIWPSLASLIRLGKDAAPGIEKLKKKSKNIVTISVFEVAHAAITAREDKILVTKLMAGGYPQKLMACDIIVAAGSKAWMNELDKMQTTQSSPNKKASYALAVLYRLDAIPLLKHAFKDNFVASCAIAELRAWGE